MGGGGYIETEKAKLESGVSSNFCLTNSPHHNVQTPTTTSWLWCYLNIALRYKKERLESYPIEPKHKRVQNKGGTVALRCQFATMTSHVFAIGSQVRYKTVGRTNELKSTFQQVANIIRYSFCKSKLDLSLEYPFQRFSLI